MPGAECPNSKCQQRAMEHCKTDKSLNLFLVHFCQLALTQTGTLKAPPTRKLTTTQTLI